MRPTIAELEAFVWTARLGSVQAAARQLFLAQPTVSLRLKSLQDELGVRVFKRAGTVLRLTVDGELLFVHALTIIDELGRLRERVGSAGEIHGTVRVGLPETFAVACLPLILKDLAARYPLLRLELSVATSSHLEDELREHRLDLAFLVHPTGGAAIRLVRLGRQEAAWIAAPSLGLRPTIRPADLQDCQLLSNPPPSAMHRQVIDWFSAADVSPRRLDYCTGQMVIAHLVQEGVAAAFLPVKLMETALAAGQVVKLRSVPQFAHAWVCAAHRVGSATAEIEAVIAAVERVLEQIPFLLPADAAGEPA
ncbi:LysR family transcriptional regulator [Chelatococcus sp. GCM10030263]|uniref:LysR family transcriptional regulator n=1 Tax=Chelatococcus sp. GCM10030263 TaxID=3273387 RepID=UPI003623618C